MGFVTPLQYKVRHICRVERYVMIFEYDELREYVEEDFDHFFKWDLMKSKFIRLF